MGGIIRCIKNEYNLDQIENEINKTDNISGFDEILDIVKRNNNAYIDDDRRRGENSHYTENFLEKFENKRTNTFCYTPKTTMKI